MVISCTRLPTWLFGAVDPHQGWTGNLAYRAFSRWADALFLIGPVHALLEYIYIYIYIYILVRSGGGLPGPKKCQGRFFLSQPWSPWTAGDEFAPYFWIISRAASSLEPVGGGTIMRIHMYEMCILFQALFTQSVEPRGLRCLWTWGNRKLSPYAMSICSDGSSAGSARRNWLVFLLLINFWQETS